MLGWVTFPIQIDREKWQTFKDAVKARNATARGVLMDLIDDYIEKFKKEQQKQHAPRKDKQR